MLEELRQCENCVCEVKDLDNELLLSGRITFVGEDDGELAIDIESLTGDEISVGWYNLTVKVEVFTKSQGVLVVHGIVYLVDREFWQIRNIEALWSEERRGFFRVHTMGDGMMYSLGQELSTMPTVINRRNPDAVAFSLLSISLSGILIETETTLSSGEYMQLYDMNLGNKVPGSTFAGICVVRRLTENRVTKKPRYGCHFLGMDDRETDRLCTAIFSLQREAKKHQKAIVE